MARVTLNIAKAYDEGFIENIEKTKFFQLHKNAATRTDLYCFAMALCEMEDKEPTPLVKLVRLSHSSERNFWQIASLYCSVSITKMS